MKPEKRHLLDDLLDEAQAARREAILTTGGMILRRRRWRRVALRSCAVLAVVSAMVFSLQRARSPRTEVPVITSTPPAPNQPKALSDAELLALFPDTPVALANLENGKKRLIFPRAGDEEKFVTKM